MVESDPLRRLQKIYKVPVEEIITPEKPITLLQFLNQEKMVIASRAAYIAIALELVGSGITILNNDPIRAAITIAVDGIGIGVIKFFDSVHYKNNPTSDSVQ